MDYLAADLAAKPPFMRGEVIQSQPQESKNKSYDERNEITIQHGSPNTIEASINTHFLSNIFVHRHFGKRFSQDTIVD